MVVVVVVVVVCGGVWWWCVVVVVVVVVVGVGMASWVRVESGLHHPFHPFFQSRAHQILILFSLIHCHAAPAWPFSPWKLSQTFGGLA